MHKVQRGIIVAVQVGAVKTYREHWRRSRNKKDKVKLRKPFPEFPARPPPPLLNAIVFFCRFLKI
jgi:hypothetical protein